MKPRYFDRLLLSSLFLCLVETGLAQTKILLPDLPCREMDREAVLFAFDQYAFPFRSRLQTQLIPGKYTSMAVPHGGKNAPDEFIRFYGTVVWIDGVFHMWYYGQNGPEPDGNGYGHGAHLGRPLLCYARSTDGVTWEKPPLGLVEYNGSKANNLVDFPEPHPVVSAAILYDPEDPDPSRKFKMVYEAMRGAARPKPCVAFSADGFHWRPQPTPIGEFLEMAGITRFRGLYYLTGQFPGPGLPRRKLLTLVSADFEHWSPCGAEGLNRSGDETVPFLDSAQRESGNHEEVHLGAALWNRGSVILGIYGQWHGDASGDRRRVTMDLGLTVTHDCVHHYEPIPGFKIIPAREQAASPAFDPPALMQGQGMENVGDKTFYWYSLWKGINEGTGVRLATWERDRLGFVQPAYTSEADKLSRAGDYFHAISCRLQVAGPGVADIYVNASGLNENTAFEVTLLDSRFLPIPGYSATVSQDGLRVPIIWKEGKSLSGSLGEVYVQVKFKGVRPEDGRLYALYLVPRGT